MFFFVMVISVSIASIRDTANTLAITPDTVATIAKPTVIHTPYCLKAGRAVASARA